jgi:hypothetical protein
VGDVRPAGDGGDADLLDDACKLIEISGDTLQVIVNQIEQRCEMAAGAEVNWPTRPTRFCRRPVDAELRGGRFGGSSQVLGE